MRIGRPFPNTQLYILDPRHQPVPVGSIGELYIGGDGLAVGYYNRPELTAERFILSPFATVDRGSNTEENHRPPSTVHRLLYRTGDLARVLPDGNIICLGRVDDQVKVHGVRIELGEVETALRSLDGIHDAVVTSWLDPRGDTQLVGHVIADKGGALTAHDLRARLRERLPEVMIPPFILFSESFPLTANGKVRRASLPVPTAAGESGPAKVPVEAPKTETEKALAKAWAAVLNIDVAVIGRDSDFLDLGGHSLLMTLLVLEIRKLFKVAFSMREFFGASTLKQLSALIDERRVDEPEASDKKPLTRADQPADWARQRMAFLEHEAQLPQYIAPARGLSYQAPKEIRTAFLTGATGFLGVYMVSEILKNTQAELYCLVRPKRGEDGKERIEKQMRRYDVWNEDEAWQAAWKSRLHIVEGDVTLPRLGMKGDIYDKLAVQVDAIFHSAAHVNFIYPYEALRATNVLGIHEVLQFAFHLRIKQVHHLSTAAIWPMGSKFTYYEKDPIKHNGILNLGYDEAKWVGEQCMLNAEERGLPVARYRPGEVGGDSVTGHCVTDHFVVACVKGFLQFGAFPDLDIEVDIAPVDYVAKAMIFLAFNRKPLGRAFHLTNPFREKLSDGIAYLRNQGYQFDVLPFEEIRDKLLSRPDFSQNALFAYQAALEDMNDVSMQLPTYNTRETERELAGSGIQCAAADQKLFETYLRYLQKIDFIPQPEELAAS
jgi:thioester reductase-like protein